MSRLSRRHPPVTRSQRHFSMASQSGRGSVLCRTGLELPPSRCGVRCSTTTGPSAITCADPDQNGAQSTKVRGIAPRSRIVALVCRTTVTKAQATGARLQSFLGMLGSDRPPEREIDAAPAHLECWQGELAVSRRPSSFQIALIAL